MVVFFVLQRNKESLRLTMIKVYIESANYLDTIVENLELIEPDEIFVELPQPQHKNFFISQYGRLYSKRRKIGHLKKESWAGNRKIKNQVRPKYQLPNKNGKYKWNFTSRLVASVFCENLEPETKIHVHHLDKNHLNNRFDNLLWVTPEEHRLLDSGRKLYIYDMDNKTLTNFKTIQELCDYLEIRKNQLRRILYYDKPNFLLEDGIGVFEFRDKVIDDKPVYVALAG